MSDRLPQDRAHQTGHGDSRDRPRSSGWRTFRLQCAWRRPGRLPEHAGRSAGQAMGEHGTLALAHDRVGTQRDGTTISTTTAEASPAASRSTSTGPPGARNRQWTERLVDGLETRTKTGVSHAELFVVGTSRFPNHSWLVGARGG